MDQVVSDRSRAKEHLERLVAALGSGLILLDSDGRIAWIDRRTRSRLNGGMEDFVSTVRTIDKSNALNCSASAIDVDINGKPAVVCVIQESNEPRETGHDLATAIEAAMADTSWFTQTIIEKLKTLHVIKRPDAQLSDLDLLTDREREVLGLICEGRSDLDMARILNLSQNTVRNHIASLYRKIGVNRRSAALIWARERAVSGQNTLGLRRRKRTRASHLEA
jgi:DNA-binding CsgD family transcriptional regulator